MSTGSSREGCASRCQRAVIRQDLFSCVASPSSLALALLLLFTHIWVNWRQPGPYMDELFHVPQAQGFCSALSRGELPAYNVAITTPPGSYLVPALLGSLLPFLCSVSGLRATSACCVFLIAFQIHAILRLLRRRLPAKSIDAGSTSMLEAFVLVLHPPLFFYAILFYTDPPAVLMILLCFRFALCERHLASATFGFLSAFCRQTSAVFHAFIAFDSVLNTLRTRRCIPDAFQTSVPHALTGLVYLAMFKANGYKIAIGDTGNHPIAIHHAMFAYHAGYCALFGLPLVLAAGSLRMASLKTGADVFRSHIRSWRWRAFYLGSVVLFASLVAATGSQVHPFVFADNRHYVFYLYRRVLLRGQLVRLAMVPFYAASIFVQFSLISFTRLRAEYANVKSSASLSDINHIHLWYRCEVLTELVLSLCVALCVVPSTLFEPRYFVPGFILIALRATARCRFSGVFAYSAAGLLMVANLALIYVFCEFPFARPVDEHMPNDLSPGRFMF